MVDFKLATFFSCADCAELAPYKTDAQSHHVELHLGEALDAGRVKNMEQDFVIKSSGDWLT